MKMMPPNFRSWGQMPLPPSAMAGGKAPVRIIYRLLWAVDELIEAISAILLVYPSDLGHHHLIGKAE